MIDPRKYLALLAEHGVARGESWALWRAVLLLLMRVKLTKDERALVERVSGRKLTSSFVPRLFAAFVGRRGGKDASAAILVVFFALLRQWRLSPGEVAVVLLLAVDREQAKVAFKYIRGLLSTVPDLAAEVESETNDRIVLKNGVEIQVATSDYKTVRGRTVVAAILDEFWFWNETDAVEVLRALRPAMATQPDAMLIVISSVYGSQGPAFELFKTWGTGDPDQLIIRGTTRDFNPTITEKFIQLELERDPVGASAEYMSVPRTDIARFIDENLLDPITRRSPLELPWTPVSATGAHFKYFACLDVSGGRSDSTAAAISRMDEDKAVICAVRHWRAPHNPMEVAKEVAAFLKEYHLNTAQADQYGAGLTTSVYSDAGLHLTPTELTRSETYLKALPLFTTGRIEIPDERTLRRELIALGRRTGRGADVVDHPPNGHDDVANAVCLAAVAASRMCGASPGDAQIWAPPSDFFADGYIQSDGTYFKS